jgi:anti-sigma regulatory factor (Ser/Thr protein kinase)
MSNRSNLRQLYRALLPERLPHLAGWLFEVLYRPADLLSADFYDFIMLPDGRLGISLGDVAGKGLAAARRMAAVSNLLRDIAQSSPGPGAALQTLNDILCNQEQPQGFITCFYAVLDPLTGILDYANAGHHPPYWRSGRSDNGQPVRVEVLTIKGFPLGIFPGVEYEQKKVAMAPGEAIFFYSDGLLEARNENGEMFSAERLAQVLASEYSSHAILAATKERYINFIGKSLTQQDDLTLIQMGRIFDGQPGSGPLQTLDTTGAITLAEYSIPSLPDYEQNALGQATQTLADIDLPTERQDKLKTALLATLQNAIYLGRREQPEQPVILQILQQPGKVRLIVSDCSTHAFPELDLLEDPEHVKDQRPPLGWELFRVQALVDEMYVTLDEGHHRVELVMHTC